MIIADYQLLQELSRNEWSVLYRGRRRENDAPVLLKTTRHNPPLPIETALLIHENEILRVLAAPGIPRVYDFFSEERGSYLVLEDSGGLPLQTLLLSRQSDLDAVIQLGLKLCTILADIHRQNFAHYHLNPWSILLHPDTKDVSLIDFTLAAAATDSAWEPLPSQALHRSLAYVAPEQTGRMNRAADYRADFYSLGLLFYELLTGAHPFRTDDTLELIHSHLARSPRSPREIRETIPEPLSQIVMKLLAKSPDQRYQSALGLKHDLESYAREWATPERFALFPLGQHDISDRFLLPQKLYGRQQELEQLLATFDGVCAGSAAFVLISVTRDLVEFASNKRAALSDARLG